MKISYNWLQEYIEESLPPVTELVDALTMHSFEVEGVEESGEDRILDIKVLPNRSHDCLSHYGMAREVSAVMNLTCKKVEDTIPEMPKFPKFEIVLKDKGFSRRVVAVLLQDVLVEESPEWLKSRLAGLGQRSINNIVDITNYVLLAFGQPMHAFNFDSISGGAIYIRPAKAGEKITLLNDKDYVLDESVHVIADKEKALDVAGIIGGKNTSTYMDTKNILLVVDDFDPVIIRKTSRKIGVRTDSSARYENNISPEVVSLGVVQALKLIDSVVTQKTVAGYTEVYPAVYKSPTIKVTVEKISSVLGKNISKDEILRILEKQNIVVEEKGSELLVTPPSYRLDLTLVENIAEEVGRLYGYNNIPPIGLETVQVTEINPNVFISNNIREALTSAGFSEIYTYALVSSGEVELENPLSGDKNFLRANLADAMAESLEQNFKYIDLLGVKEVKLFEIGKVFTTNGEALHLSIGVKYSKGKKTHELDEEIARAITLAEKSLGVSFGDISIVGGIAEINLEKIKMEVSVPGEYPDDAWANPQKHVSFKPISPYPFAVRDVAVFVPNDVPVEKVTDIIKQQLTSIVVRFSLFDTFVKGDKTSYAFRLIFQAPHKTLTDEEINSVMNPIYEVLKAEEGFEIR